MVQLRPPAWDRRAGLILGLLALAACSAETAPAADCFTGKGMPVSVRDPATTPSFVWTAGCPAWHLSVGYTEGSSFIGVWEFHTPAATNDIQSPVVYGTVPGGVDVTTPAAPLVAGRTYKVEISNWDSGQGGAGYLGLAWFTH